jgi:NADPH2:quinone reductase
MLTKALRLVKRGGRIAYPNGVEPAPRERKGVRVIGYDADVSPATFAKLSNAADAIDLAVPIAHAYPLNRVSQAHARIERGHAVGRIVLKIR